MNGTKRVTSYYFDACVYLAYLRNEESAYGKAKIRAIRSIWEQSERAGAAVITSALTLTEVLAKQLPAKGRKKFNQAIESGIHQIEDVTPPIAIKASEYRTFYDQSSRSKSFRGRRSNRFDGSRCDTSGDGRHLRLRLFLHVRRRWEKENNWPFMAQKPRRSR
jgi:hypothetical protein